jgi:hypothetical protein
MLLAAAFHGTLASQRVANGAAATITATVAATGNASATSNADVTVDAAAPAAIASADPRAATPTALTVWAIHDGQKILRDDLNSPYKSRNAIWDGRTIHLTAGRNEIIAFQVIVESGAAGIQRLSAALPSLTLSKSSSQPQPAASTAGGPNESEQTPARQQRIQYAAPAADPTLYRDRPIGIYAQHYMHVTDASRAEWAFKPGSPSAPAGYTGWVPVQLVPENARAGRGGFPIAVAPRQNQGLWFEVYVDRALPAGVYRGAVSVTADGRVRRLPVELEVLAYTLPDENTLPAMVYYEESQVPLYHGAALHDAYHRFAKRHRVEFVHDYTEDSVERAFDRFDGSAFTAAHGYAGPGAGLGYRIVPRTFYGPGPTFSNAETARPAADAWMAFMRRRLPGRLTFMYMPDEPRPATFAQINAIGESLRSRPDAPRALPTFVTKWPHAEIAGAIDIWCSVAWKYDLAQQAQARDEGQRFWFYNGGRPSAGTIIIDAPATEARTMGWAAFKERADGFFYWNANHWKHNSQKKTGPREQNVWANPVTFDNRSEGKDDNGFINGDGVLVYPGQERLHPDEDRGVAGPVSTIQMANLRRGLQDYEMLTLARRFGLLTEIDAAVARVVPRIFAQAQENDAVGFAEDGDSYETARLAVARALSAKIDAARTATAVAAGITNGVSIGASNSVSAGHRARTLPPIAAPVMFDTPEADRILSALQVFPPDNPWNVDISVQPRHPRSDAIIASIGADKSLNFNLDMAFIIVPPDQPRVPVTLLDYPDESDPGPFPMPDNAPIENWPLAGNEGRNEDAKALPAPGQTLAQLQRTGAGDRHVILVDHVHHLLHEFWQTRRTDAGWQASNAATFNLQTGAYRPEGWTSSDAAGLPIFPAVVRYDEVARGMVQHAMRFTVRRTRRGYVLPATHWASTHRDVALPRMGERFRLRQDFDVSGFPPHAQAILKGLKKYGMFVADNGGDWLMSIAPDRRFEGLDSLTRVKGSDFEVVDTGERGVVSR